MLNRYLYHLLLLILYSAIVTDSIPRYNATAAPAAGVSTGAYEGIACRACNAKKSVNVPDTALHAGAKVPHRLSDDWDKFSKCYNSSCMVSDGRQEQQQNSRF